MDLSITLTPEGWEARGARAYDQGLGQDDHGLRDKSPARKYWQAGWHRQRIVREREAAAEQLAEVSPS